MNFLKNLVSSKDGLLVIALSICAFSPIKALGFIAPIIFIALIFIKSPRRVMLTSFMLLITILLQSIYINFHYVYYYQNMLIWLITFSWMLFSLVKTRFSISLGDSIVKFFSYLLILEATIGIVQGLYGFIERGSFGSDSGDRVAGTIKLSLSGGGDFSNAIYTINMLMLGMIIIPRIKDSTRRGLTFALCALAILFSSVIHAILMMFISVLLSALIVSRGNFLTKRVVKSAFYVGILIIPVYLILGDNLRLTEVYIDRILNASSPRGQIIASSFNEVIEEYGFYPYIGLGAGQMSSRASLIGSQMYFGGPTNPQAVPLLRSEISEPMEKHFMSVWIDAASRDYYGSTDQPHFSWLSVWLEWGIFGVLTMLLFFITWIGKIYKKYKGDLTLSIANISIPLFVILLGFQENYWELPQSIILGIVIQKYFLSTTGAKDDKEKIGFLN